MIKFLGEYEATLDAKGRFLLPAGFKKQLPEGECRFVATRGFDKYLTLYPQTNWDPISDEMGQMNDFNPKIQQFSRMLGATPVEMDTAGRLLVPPRLKEYAALSKDIVLVAAVGKIEIWDATAYEQHLGSFSPEAFSTLAGEVMGGANRQTKIDN